MIHCYSKSDTVSPPGIHVSPLASALFPELVMVPKASSCAVTVSMRNEGNQETFIQESGLNSCQILDTVILYFICAREYIIGEVQLKTPYPKKVARETIMLAEDFGVTLTS